MHTTNYGKSIMTASSLVQSVLGGGDGADRILIQDTVAQSGRGLLKYCVRQLVQRYSSVHLFLFDTHFKQWSDGLQSDVKQRLTLHDCYSDALGWNSDNTTPNIASGILNSCTLQTYLSRLGDAERDCCVVVFDSLSSLLLHHSSSQVSRLLHGMSNSCSVLLCLIHTDLHKDHVISQLCHVMSTTIVIKPVDREKQPQENYAAMCTVQHRKKTGKIQTKKELYTIGDSFLTMTTTDHSLSVTSQATVHGQQSHDPTSNLTFDLRLSSKEKEDRAKVVLPYTSVIPKTEASLSPNRGTGQIFYQPDEADDFDDSDPDDDLDF